MFFPPATFLNVTCYTVITDTGQQIQGLGKYNKEHGDEEYIKMCH